MSKYYAFIITMISLFCIFKSGFTEFVKWLSYNCYLIQFLIFWFTDQMGPKISWYLQYFTSLLVCELYDLYNVERVWMKNGSCYWNLCLWSWPYRLARESLSFFIIDLIKRCSFKMFILDINIPQYSLKNGSLWKLQSL